MNNTFGRGGFRKFRADHIFDGQVLLPGSLVLITTADGTVTDLVDRADAGDDIEVFEGILSPGFINAHCHLELSHLKGQIPRHTGLIDFVFAVMGQRQTSADTLKTSMEEAENAMWQNGIVAVGDICNTGNSIPQKARRRLAYYNFIELAGWLPAQAAARFATGFECYQAFAQALGTEDHLVLTPHAPYSVSEDLWTLIRPNFKGRTVSMHNQETAAENELFLRGDGAFRSMYERMNIQRPDFIPPGTSSLQAVFPEMTGAASILLVHNTFTSASDIARTQEQNSFFCLCPNANLYIENKLPPLALLRSMDARLVLGTDSLASNDQLNILEEIKTIAQHFQDIPTAEMLRWATINGAQALQMDGLLGSFETGKKPGVVLISRVEGTRITAGSGSSRLI